MPSLHGVIALKYGVTAVTHTHVCPVCCSGTTAPLQSLHVLQFCFACRRTRTCLSKRNAPNLFCGYDLQCERTILWSALRGRSKITKRAIPRLTVRTGKQARSFVTGTAWFRQHRVTVTTNKESDAADALETLAHELTHLAYPRFGHEPAFYGVLSKLLREVYGTVQSECEKRENAFDRDARLVLALRAALARQTIA